MRCPKCNAWATPDMAACKECGAELKVGPTVSAGSDSMLDRYRSQIDADRQNRVNPIYTPGAVGPQEIPEFDLGDAPSLPAIERAMAEDVTVDAQPLGVLNLLLLHAGERPVLKLSIYTRNHEE